MKKIVLLWLMMVSLPLAGISQGYVDDLYYVPDEEEEVAGEEKAESAPETPAVRDVSAPASSSGSVVASRDAGNVRDVDAAEIQAYLLGKSKEGANEEA